MNHITSDEILKYLFKKRIKRKEFEKHIAECKECHIKLEGIRLGFEIYFEEKNNGKKIFK